MSLMNIQISMEKMEQTHREPAFAMIIVDGFPCEGETNCKAALQYYSIIETELYCDSLALLLMMLGFGGFVLLNEIISLSLVNLPIESIFIDM